MEAFSISQRNNLLRNSCCCSVPEKGIVDMRFLLSLFTQISYLQPYLTFQTLNKMLNINLGTKAKILSHEDYL